MIRRRICGQFARTAMKDCRIQRCQNRIEYICLLKSGEARFRIRKPYWTGCFKSSIWKPRKRNKDKNQSIEPISASNTTLGHYRAKRGRKPDREGRRR